MWNNLLSFFFFLLSFWWKYSTEILFLCKAQNHNSYTHFIYCLLLEYPWIYIYIYIYTYTHTHTYIYTHTHTHERNNDLWFSPQQQSYFLKKWTNHSSLYSIYTSIKLGFLFCFLNTGRLRSLHDFIVFRYVLNLPWGRPEPLLFQLSWNYTKRDLRLL